ncbi:RrF2 family transcriptional regulator [Haliangium sp.]|uniref:RrF2 family transcriptional regulator n=1 Tax=Haliangium sp. TaxID=2663208 RepID=UPI003D101E3B
MVANSKLAVALHVMTALAYSDGRLLTSEQLADSIHTNPVVVRRIISELARAGLVESRRGKAGGARLARPASSITLFDIYRAIDGMGPFCLPKPGSESCIVANCMPDIVSDVIGDIDNAIEDTLRHRTVADLVTRVR